MDLVWMGEAPTDDRADELAPWQPGMAFWSPYNPAAVLSVHYRDHVAAVRRPIVVMLPYRSTSETPDPHRYGCSFWLDSHPTDDPFAAWDVTVDLASLVVGARPNITVAPSISVLGIYHGFLQAGVLTDDIGSP